ncbi:MAG TPA: pseudouridine synthase [Solirubrobacteraceae bacterium]|nr:pseudouridine synthase [Solirubrobacteraceae bacterium]
MRLAKYLAHAGVASRRAAEDLIRAGRVTVEGERVADLGRQVDATIEVRVDGAVVGGPEERTVWMVNKPAGVVSTARDTHGRRTVVDLVPSGARLYPVGRLDADTTGLILLTNDGELANRLLHPRYEVPRTYVARVGGGRVSPDALRALRAGVPLEDGVTAPAEVRVMGDSRLELVLHEGRKRQVRRMCEAVGHPVLALSRVGFGPVRLGGLAAGQARRLGAEEVEALRTAAARK